MIPIPAGWKLVPIEPTPEMWAAVNKLDDEMAAGAYDGKGASIEQVWNCLVETAPEAPSITVALDPDPRGVSIGVWQGSSCIYTGAHAIPSSAPDAPLASMARAIFGDQIGSQMDAMAGAPSLSSLRGFAPGACEGMKSEDYVNKVRNDDWSSPECTPAPSAPGDAQEDRQDWMACEMRRRIVTDNLKLSAAEMRARENRCRIAYKQDYMGAPMRWLADVYAEAATVLEAKNAALAAQVPQQGEA